MPANYAANDPDAYEQMMGRWSRKLAPQFVAFAELDNPATILDVGCGTGNLTVALASRFQDANVTGLDQSRAFIASARSLDAATIPPGFVTRTISRTARSASGMKFTTSKDSVASKL